MLPKQAKVTEDTEILWKSGRGDVACFGRGFFGLSPITLLAISNL